MPYTIADLAQFIQTTSNNYRQRTEQVLDYYRFERATEMESDCHDRWSLIRFGDGSELIIGDDYLRPRNDNAVDWSSPHCQAQMERIAESLRPH